MQMLLDMKMYKQNNPSVRIYIRLENGDKSDPKGMHLVDPKIDQICKLVKLV